MQSVVGHFELGVAACWLLYMTAGMVSETGETDEECHL